MSNYLVGTQYRGYTLERDGLDRSPLHHAAIKNYNNCYFKLAVVLLENGTDNSGLDQGQRRSDRPVIDLFLRSSILTM